MTFQDINQMYEAERWVRSNLKQLLASNNTINLEAVFNILLDRIDYIDKRYNLLDRRLYEMETRDDDLDI